MSAPHLTVISTGLHPPTKDRCIQSVLSQEDEPNGLELGKDYSHIYVDAGRELIVNGVSIKKTTFDPKLVHLIEHLEELDPHEVVCMLDGDDWLKPGALKLIADMYAEPNVWCTYGQFEYVDKEPGFALEYMHEDFRGAPWYGTHLKTFRAGLWHRIDGSDFIGPNGRVMVHCDDMQVMFPILEMAGLEHSRFNPVPIYVYNIATSFQMNAGAEGRRQELAVESFIRKKPRYKPVTDYRV